MYDVHVALSIAAYDFGRFVYCRGNSESYDALFRSWSESSEEQQDRLLQSLRGEAEAILEDPEYHQASEPMLAAARAMLAALDEAGVADGAVQEEPCPCGDPGCVFSAPC